MDDKSQPVTGGSIFHNLIKKIVKKVDNQADVDFNQSNPILKQPQPIYSDQNQLVNYTQQISGNATQQAIYSNEQQYNQIQSGYHSMSTADYTNYYATSTPALSNNYLYAQTSTELFQSNYDTNQMTNLPAPLDLNSSQALYQSNYTNYVPQQTPSFYDQQQWHNTPLSQQITPLSAAYQPQQFSFNQYTHNQDNQIVNLSFNPSSATNSQPFIQQQPSNQISASQVLNTQQLSLATQLTSQQLSGQPIIDTNQQQAPSNQYSAQQTTNLTQQPSFNQSTTQQLNLQQTIPNVTAGIGQVSSIHNLQNIPPTDQSTKNQQQHSTWKPMMTSAAQGTIAPPLLNKIKQKMASHGNKMMTMIKASPTSDINQKTDSTVARKGSFCPTVTGTNLSNQAGSVNTEELTAHLTEEEKQILAKVFQKEEAFQRETSGRGPLLNITSMSGNAQQQTSLTSPALGDSSNVFASTTVTSLGNCRTCLKRIKENEEHHYCDNCSQIICEDCSSYSGKHQAKQWWCSYCRRRGTQPCIAAGFEDAIAELNTQKYPQHQRRRFTMLPGVNEKDDLTQSADSNRPRSRSRTPSQRGRRPSLADTRGRQSSLDLSQPNESQEQLNQENACDTFKSLETDVINQQKSLDHNVDQRSSSFDRMNSSFERTNSNSIEQTGSHQQQYNNNQYRASIQLQSLQAINNQLLQRRRSSISKRPPLNQRPSLTTPAPIALPHTLDTGCTAREQLLIAGKLPRKSYSASDSSLDELLDPNIDTSLGDKMTTQNYNSSQLNQISPHPSDEEEESSSNLVSTARLSRSVHQLSTSGRSSGRSNTSPLASQNLQPTVQQQQYNIPAIHTTNEIYPTDETSSPIGKSNSSTMLTRNTSSSIRRPSSARIRKQSACFTYETSELNQQSNRSNNHLPPQNQTSNNTQTPHTAIRRQSDSQGSEGSEPIDNSLSLSSPDYLRSSPRQSADSDILGLPSMSPLSSQRRSIPSVLVDTADPNHLTLKDALNRRNSSTGRVLPMLPKVEQSRSLLELPQRTCSTHSLNIPNTDLPRRASAPEGENIKIVIDDFGDELNFQNFQQGFRRKQIERVILHRDHTENRSVRSQGFGLCVCGGKLDPQDGQLYAIVAWVLPGGSADKMAVKLMDKILQWNGTSLINMSYEQVANLIANSGDQAELLIEPYIRDEKKSSTVHQKRRLSQGGVALSSLSASSMEMKSGSLKSNSSSLYASTNLQSTSTQQQQSNQTVQQLTTGANQLIVQTSASSGVVQQSNQVPITTASVPSTSSTLTTASANLASRRKLPQLPSRTTPDQQQHTLQANNASLSKPTNQINLVHQQSSKSSQVLIQCSLDEERRELVVSLICAQLQRTNINAFCYGQVRILPTLGFSSCKTELSKTMEWNETLIFKSFPVEKIFDMALEIKIWEQEINSQTSAQQIKSNLLAETIIPLESAIKHASNKSEWWPLLSVPILQQQQISAVTKTTNQTNFPSIAPGQLLTTNQLQDRCVSAEYLSMNQFLDSKLDTKHLITESKSVPSSRRNSGQMNAGHNSTVPFPFQPTLQHNSNTNALNVNNSSFSNQLMNRRSSSSATAIVTTASNRYLNAQTMNVASTSAINQIKSKPDYLSSSASHLSNLDPMTNNYVGNELVKTSSATLTTNTLKTNFLDVNNNSNAYNNLRRKSSSALVNAPKFNRTMSLRSNSTNETDTIVSGNNQNSMVIEQQQVQLSPQMQSTQLHHSIQQIANTPPIQQSIQQQPLHQTLHQQNSLTIQSECGNTLTRQPSVQMRSGLIKSMTDVDKQIDRQYSQSTISSVLATPSRRPSSSTGVVQPRCISAMDNLRRRPMSISANSCSSSEELTDTESLSKTGSSSKNEIDYIRNGKIIGQIQLGILMAKSCLEVHILEAKLDSTKLQSLNNVKPDTYVKTYLKEDRKKMYKKKTKIVVSSWEPSFKQTIKYNASEAYNRTLLVMLWQKQKGFQSSTAIGVVEIAINQMELSKMTIDWYNLCEMNLKEKQKLLRQQSDNSSLTTHQ